ncbi:cyclodeaminase/cyclohydrolase family protein [Candidatus Methylospira mobilis]|uniref:Cyclodeaminase/cyclohydrolase family protein n=1 Tax=Candidatus Methylospira mobilis TaxID=1808979 RepID=A0A5Q0BL03_9GAMM|nr:methenyltetrahydrofolate cyclohydrolase [Candidatus Methylospira mobilis]QFY42881.1 cyclodeaminase/cyclohydrolase family protein [Candidatus Methylospira mobilis]WNV04060.1 cyclodeaminase/cyclohydrolase family protein [Candidatus Methylospira mobilis]
MIEDTSLEVFLNELASKTPTPGGGSAAAIMGGMGAALVAMVCNLTINKKAYEAVDAEMRDILQRAEVLREQLTGMMRQDIEAFDRVMSAYGLPRETEAEKAVRSQAIQSALKDATEVPLACARASAEIIALSRVVAEKGNKNVVSDAGVAVVAAYAALKSSALSVRVNTGALSDVSFATQSITELDVILDGADTAMREIYQEVVHRL